MIHNYKVLASAIILMALINFYCGYGAGHSDALKLSGSPTLLGADYGGFNDGTEAWANVRAAYVASGNDKCAMCGSTRGLRIRHISGDECLKYDPDNLVTFCPNH